MELDALSRREPKRAVAVAVRELVERQILRRREAAAGYAHAHHQLGQLAEALLFELRRDVAVVALIDAVELEQNGGVAAEGRRAGADLFGEPPAQTVACELDLLDLGGTGVSGHGKLPAS